MIFNELYSAYYNAVAKIITAVIDGKTDDENLNRIVCSNAFGESMLTVLPSLKNEKWQLIKADMTTPLKHSPTMPLTLIQKQWLKAILLDPRIKLFGAEINGLDNIEPLFTPDDYYIYDKYGDGDRFEDEKYIEHFRTVLFALKNKKNLKIEMLNRKGNIIFIKCIPERLEYSEKDDKFRLVTSGNRFIKTVNLARITKCKIYEEPIFYSSSPETKLETVTLKVRDERNALERCMLHFAHFEKRAEKVDNNHYLVHIRYNKTDETEMVIRVLSFGPMVEVIAPDSFRKLIIERLQRQKSCELS